MAAGINSRIFRNINQSIKIIILNDKIKTPIQRDNDFLIRQIGISPEIARNYPEAQFNTYSQLWRSLQTLRVFGEDLWKKATKENIVVFSKQLNSTQDLIDRNAIYFNETDYTDLKQILKAMGDFRIGKVRIYEMRRDSNLLRFANFDAIDSQIKSNAKYKEEYEDIINRIRISFRDQLTLQQLPERNRTLTGTE